MTGDDLLEDLLDRWEDARDRGEPVAPEDLCRDHPELAAELARRVAELRAADEFLEGPHEPDRTATLIRPPGWTHPADGVAAVAPEERYGDERFLAEGGLGRVYRARDAELPREVALKRLQDGLVGSAEGRRRFVFEAEVTARLEHPGVVPVYGLGVDRRGHPFYAMRLIRGETLARAIGRFHEADAPGRDPGERSVAFRALLGAFLTVCRTVAYAHSRGVIHRDIKPANVMIGPYGETLLVDWGLAKTVGTGAGGDGGEPGASDVPWPSNAASGLDPTSAGVVKGSPAYMSPEQAAGQADRVRPASDVYALGATLYTLLTGARPFQGGGVAEVLAKVRGGDFPPPRRLKPVVPRALQAVCLKAMSVEPADRYAGAVDLAADVERWLSGEPVLAWREPWYDRLRRWGRRHRVLVAAAAAAVVVAAAVLALTNGRLRALAGRLDTANGQLRVALDAAERDLYARDLALADLAWWDGQTGRVAGLLAECPAARRGWEWHYLARRNRPGLFSAPRDSRPPLAFALDGGGERVVTTDPVGVVASAFPSGDETRWVRWPRGRGRAVALSRDFERVAYVTADRPREADVATPRGGVATARVPDAVPGAVESLGFGPDGRSLVLVVVRRDGPDPASKEKISFRTSFDARVVVRGLDRDGDATVSEPFTASGTPGPPTVAPGGRVLLPVVFGSTDSLFAVRPGSARVEKLWPVDGEEGGGHALAVAPDGRWFATAGDDHAVTVREAATGRLAAVFRGHTERVRCLNFRRDGGRLASGGDDGMVRVWDVERREPVAVLRGHTAGIERLAFSADGARLASASDRLIVWEADHGPEARVVREAERPHVADLAVGPGDRAAVVAGHRLAWRDARTGRALDGPEVEADVVAACPRGPWTAAGEGDGMIALLDASGRRARELRGHRDRVTSLSFDREGRRLASASLDGTVKVWDTAAGRERADLVAGPVASPVAALSPDGTLLATGGDGGVVSVRLVSTGEFLHKISRGGAPLRRLEFSPDGSGLLVVRSSGPGPEGSRGGDLSVWDVAKGSARLGLGDHPSGVTDAAFSPDGLRLVSADREGQVRVWEAATGRPLLILRGPGGPISRLAFTADGHRLVAAGGRVDPLGQRTEETSELTVWDGRPLD